ncbi:MAG: hypothetical protein SPI30_04890 [Prevotella sp.]|nr:hypothetical protein [Prevotella sp.]
MRKIYLRPAVEMVSFSDPCALMAGSGNSLSGTIHAGNGENENIGAGNDDEGPVIGDAKSGLWFADEES